MRTAIRTFTLPSLLSKTFAAAFMIPFNLSLAAQQPVSNSVDMQHEAMRKLSFLAGHWSGPVTIVRGPGEALHLTQTENVEYKLDGPAHRGQKHQRRRESTVQRPGDDCVRRCLPYLSLPRLQ